MGYDVSDYKEVDRIFGSLEDFDSLVERAHALGLKVIIDQVLSHTSDQHPWFRESRLSRTNARADWYVWADPKSDGSPPNNWPSVFGGRAWEWNPSRRQYYFHNFLAEQPDLNFHNPAVQDAVLDVMRFWLERGVDGFRLDTVNYYLPRHAAAQQSAGAPQEAPALRGQSLRHAGAPILARASPRTSAFLKRVRKLLDEFPGTTTVGEVGDSHKGLQLMAEYTSGGDKLHMCYYVRLLGPEFTAEHFRTRIERFFAAGPNGWPCWSLLQPRRRPPRDALGASTAPRRARSAEQAVALLLSLTGSVCLYQGEELGLPETDLLFEELTDPPRHPLLARGQGPRRLPHARCRGTRARRPTASPPASPGCRSSRRSRRSTSPRSRPTPDSLLNFYREVLAFRRAHPVLIEGDIAFIKTGEPVLAFRRTRRGRKHRLHLQSFARHRARHRRGRGRSCDRPRRRRAQNRA